MRTRVLMSLLFLCVSPLWAQFRGMCNVDVKLDKEHATQFQKLAIDHRYPPAVRHAVEGLVGVVVCPKIRQPFLINGKTHLYQAVAFGTGFIVEHDHRLLVSTAFHVVAEEIVDLKTKSSYYRWYPEYARNYICVDGDKFEAKVVGVDAENDLAVLELVDSNVKLSKPPLTIGESDLTPGEYGPWFAFAFYTKSPERQITFPRFRGWWNEATASRNTVPKGKLARKARHGFSGGPVIAKDGRVEGVIQAYIDDGSQTTVFTPTVKLTNLLERIPAQ